MTGFSKRLLVFAVGALAFAGASYGQNITSCAGGQSTGGTALGAVQPGALNLRHEATTELVGDFLFNCTNTGGPSSTGTITSFLSAAVTSKLLTTNTSGNPAYTEATLFICTGNVPCNNTNGTPYSGVVTTPTQLLFSNISLPAGSFSGRIYNVRINANSVTVAATLTTATEFILTSANGTSASTGLPSTVGYIFNSLNPLAFGTNPNGPNTPTITAYTTCVGNPLPTIGNINVVGATPPGLFPPTNYSFLAGVSQTFGGAFKVGTGPSPGGEGGSYLGPGGAGTATFGTRIQLVFGNVSTGMTIYVPTSVTFGPLTLTLTSSATGAFTAVAPTTVTGQPVAGTIAASFAGGGSYASSAPLTVASGSATAVYEVTATNPQVIEAAFIPAWVTFAPNAFSTPQGPITLQESYAPTATAGAATTIPNFAPVTGTSPTTTVATCATNLLFPFVTNVSGFDTGLVLSNTSMDPFGTSPTPGSCSLNFYGTGAPSPATGVAAPNPTGGGVPYTQPAGSDNAFLLSGVAPGFTGYVIAVCNYQYGYGYAFIESGLGTNAGVAEGYIAVNLNPRPVGGNAIIGQ
jgi:hypothetical protein